MQKIVGDSIELFVRQRNRMPRRIVVDKSTRFSDEETQGCKNACETIDVLDIVHLMEWPSFRASHLKHDYPVVRGTAVVDTNEAMLFTSGICNRACNVPRTRGPSSATFDLSTTRYVG